MVATLEQDPAGFGRGGRMNLRSGNQALGLVGILAATVTLIALTWVGTFTAIHTQRAEAESRMAASVTNQAQMFEDQLQRQFLEVDQTLRLVAHAWQADPAHFNMLDLRDQLVLLNEISPTVFIVDDHGVVEGGTVPELVGTSVRNRDYFRYESGRIFDDGRMFVGPSTMGALVREWHMNLARQLHHPDGSFAGVIVASLRITAVGSFYQMANIGRHGIVALIGLQDGLVRVAEGTNPVDPGSSIAGSDMFKALQADPDAVWVGRSALDGVERVHDFHRVADRDVAVVVAVDKAEAMQATDAWESAAIIFAAGITVLLVSLAAILLHATHAARRRQAALMHDRAMLAGTNSELQIAKARADDKTAQLEATLAGMSDGVAMVDGHLQLVEWNPRFPDVAGLPEGLLRVGLPMEDILRAQATSGQFGAVDIEAEVARRMAALRAGNFPDITERTRPDGTVVELRRNRLPDGGFVTLYSEITVRKHSENALREANALAEAATQAMSRFVAIVSHEIRTPLNALLSSLTLLADGGVTATQQVLLDMARQSGDALMALINDILEMSRMEAGQLALRPSTFALRPLIDSVLAMFGGQAMGRRIALRCSIAQGVPDELYEDPVRVRQVLINLLSNAIKFAAAGEVRVLAETRREGGRTTLRLAVRDRGPVIPEPDRSRLFHAFVRLERGGDDTAAGSGLGLAICEHLVALMGGEIGCSVWTFGGRDAGNEFWLVLPIKPLPTEATMAPVRPEVQSRRWLPRTRILLVEDILANQLVTSTLLRREGHLVDIAGNAQEAIAAVASQPYDLIFMDIFMPGMSGFDTARQIRGTAGPAATVPIVALTANVCPEDQALCASAGMNEMLGKPVSLQELLDAIARHVWPHRPEHRQPHAVAVVTASLPSPILSASRVADLRATLPPDTLASLVEDCLIDLSERVVMLQDALQQETAGLIIEHAHAVAGMAAEYGMAALEARMRLLMQIVREDPHAAAAMADELEAEVFRAGAALREALNIEMV
jgi:signal transduction histidine kinase/DNA-binding response OmpR family regulator